MTPRLRLPAYGKHLLEERRAGRHPLVVHVFYSDEWRDGERCEEGCLWDPMKRREDQPEGVHPRLVVKPSDYKPGTLDWRLVTGCLVVVFDHRPELFVGGRPFYSLLGEIGQYAGPVHVYRLELVKVIGDVGAWDWKFHWQAHRIAAPSTPADGGKWPSWWPEEIEKANSGRRERWFRLRADQQKQAAAA